MAVKVVTDSTSDLTQELAEQMDIEIVPLKVLFGDQEFRDGVDLSAEDFYERLVDSQALPTTSQPSVGEFVDVYERIGQDADGIVSIHVSSKLSGTYNAALQAKGEAKVSCPIEVVDTSQASMVVGMVVIAAAQEAQAGADLEAVAEKARKTAERTECIALFDTLEYLEKGGRIGKARALVATLLSIKPMIIIRDGEVQEFAKERTWKRAVARLERAARDFAPLEELAICYSTNVDDAKAVAENLAGLLPEGKSPYISQYGPVIGTYVGPNGLGIGVIKR